MLIYKIHKLVDSLIIPLKRFFHLFIFIYLFIHLFLTFEGWSFNFNHLVIQRYNEV